MRSRKKLSQVAETLEAPRSSARPRVSATNGCASCSITDSIIGAIGPVMRGEIKKSGQSAALGLEYDINIIGHWHQELNLPRAIVSNTLKGFDEYARLQLGAKPTRPTQPLWFVHPTHGITARWSMYVDEPGKPATKWISVFAEHKAAA